MNEEKSSASMNTSTSEPETPETIEPTEEQPVEAAEPGATDEPSVAAEPGATDEPSVAAEPNAIGEEEIARLKGVFSSYIDEVRVNNPNFTAQNYLEERENWYIRNVPGDCGLDSAVFEFPFDPKNPPKVSDAHESEDEG